ncbi:hypothetical protein PZ897_01935 [Hoeflea sp. YIM 152468]|uniref:hypothetical protein n=1 Tax=Hoeflea sp. YIM 152468 TaxID=3031759 RepID=UPI0023DB8910|nr:hypothetical protein [Hoeflea sp. YIM 152468]MDF1606930.1 hypothetical protein [Hoeflea sp. YIM 152468]
MTTKNSPLRVLKAQADQIAATIMAAERGEKIDAHFADKLKEARRLDSFKIGIAMDDKIVTIDIGWDLIRSTGEVALAQYILDQMRETRRVLN